MPIPRPEHWVYFDEASASPIPPPPPQSPPGPAPSIEEYYPVDIWGRIPAAALQQQYDRVIYQMVGGPASPPNSRPDTHFTIRNIEAAEFYNHVYWNAQFSVGSTQDHRDFTVTPEHCNSEELESIRDIRRAVGLDRGRLSYLDVVGAPTPTSRRRKLPREEIEALPLPG